MDLGLYFTLFLISLLVLVVLVLALVGGSEKVRSSLLLENHIEEDIDIHNPAKMGRTPAQNRVPRGYDTHESQHKLV